MRPLLAATIKDVARDVMFPCLTSPKIDGVRCLAYEGAAMSRSFKQLPNRHVRELFCNYLLNGFDGEIVVGDPTDKTCFNTTSSAVMSQDGRPQFRFFVFDIFTSERQYDFRLAELERRIHTLALDWILLVPQLLHKNAEELLEHERAAVALGYEGIMVRSPNGYYKQGRSTLREQYLMKLKRFTDAEAVCVGFEELRRNENEPEISPTGYQVRSSHKDQMVPAGVLGALTCVWGPTGETFKVGTGFSASDREALWATRDSLPGRLVKFKYQDYGVKDAPRLPVFIGFRASEDV